MLEGWFDIVNSHIVMVKSYIGMLGGCIDMVGGCIDMVGGCIDIRVLSFLVTISDFCPHVIFKILASKN